MDDPIAIFVLDQYAYCPRHCHLIHAEAELEDYTIVVHTERVPRGVKLWVWNANQGTLVKT